VEPFGQEDSAKKLTENSVKESDGMIDQIENAQGVEAKRSVYRALTKLRGATIASYDGIAKGHLKNVDKYNKQHKWRDEHKISHLAEEEADTHKWAFPVSPKKAVFLQKVDPNFASLADQELERIQVDEDLGIKEDETKGADTERLSWDEGVGEEEQIEKDREEEEYSFVQTGKETPSSLADQMAKEVDQLSPDEKSFLAAQTANQQQADELSADEQKAVDQEVAEEATSLEAFFKEKKTDEMAAVFLPR